MTRANSQEVQRLNERLPQYCTAELSRHGRLCVYFRRLGKTGRVRIKEAPFTQEFWAHYAALLAGAPPPMRRERLGAADHSWRWLCQQYFQSVSYRSLAARGQRVRRATLTATWTEPTKPGSPLQIGDCPLDRFGVRAVRLLRDRKLRWEARQNDDGEHVEFCTNIQAANSLLKYVRGVLAFGKEAFPDLVERNWGKDVDYFSSAGTHHTWSLEEIAQFEGVHPVGSKARLAMALGLFTGQRLGDLVRLGHRCEQDGLLIFVQEKNRLTRPVTAYVPIVPALRQIIDASKTGDLFYLAKENGQPYSKESLGNLFREWCDRAGLPACSAHGLRKACVVRLIMDGCTPHQVMSITGHQTLKEVDRYAREYLRQPASVQVLDAWLNKYKDILETGS